MGTGIDIGFIDDHRLRGLIEKYYEEAVHAHEAAAYLGSLATSGAIVEGILTWGLLRKESYAQASKKAPKNKDGQALPLTKWNVTSLIQVAAELELIGKTAQDASWALRDFRNFIHPFSVLNQSARPDEALSSSALAAVHEITRSLRGRLESR